MATDQATPTPLPNPFHTFPHPPTIPIAPFRVNIPQADIDDLQRRIQDAPKPRATYENSTTDEPLGITREWLTRAVDEWKRSDWRETEAEFNAFPQFTAALQHKSHDYTVHFLALFSRKPDAVPIVFTHGWPGSVIEFLPLLHHLAATYTPDTLPVHVVVPSLVGYGFSSPPPLDADFATRDNADLFDALMTGLGFARYMAQGGDVGSLVARFLGTKDGCKGVHLNMISGIAKTPDQVDLGALDEFDRACVERWDYFIKWEFAYKHEHATKSATIGFVLESSPIALLSWIGEKFLVWSDEDPPLSTILANVSLYWLQNTISTGLYHYRTSAGKRTTRELTAPDLGATPVGYSLFKKEIAPIPGKVVEESVPLAWFRRHERGGHFAALEQPEVFWEHVWDFTQHVWA